MTNAEMRATFLPMNVCLIGTSSGITPLDPRAHVIPIVRLITKRGKSRLNYVCIDLAHKSNSLNSYHVAHQQVNPATLPCPEIVVFLYAATNH